MEYSIDGQQFWVTVNSSLTAHILPGKQPLNSKISLSDLTRSGLVLVARDLGIRTTGSIGRLQSRIQDSIEDHLSKEPDTDSSKSDDSDEDIDSTPSSLSTSTEVKDLTRQITNLQKQLEKQQLLLLQMQAQSLYRLDRSDG